MPDPEMMTADDPPPPRRSAFEWSLAALRPADSDAERPSFLFKAGQASRERAVRFWRWVAVGSLAALVGVTAVGFVLVADLRERAAVAEARIASSPPPAGSGEPVSPAEIAAALRTRRDILTGGLGVVPDATPAPPPTALERELNTVPPTVLAIPRITPKKPAPIAAEDEVGQ